MAKLFKITKGSYSRREDGKGNKSKNGKFVHYSARSENNIIRMEEETYKHLKERLCLVPHTVNAKRKSTAKANDETSDKSNEGSE